MTRNFPQTYGGERFAPSLLARATDYLKEFLLFQCRAFASAFKKEALTFFLGLVGAFVAMGMLIVGSKSHNDGSATDILLIGIGFIGMPGCLVLAFTALCDFGTWFSLYEDPTPGLRETVAAQRVHDQVPPSVHWLTIDRALLGTRSSADDIEFDD